MPDTQVPLSKEEQKFQIIEKVNPCLAGKLKTSGDEISCNTAFLAMDELAKIESIAFVEWVNGGHGDMRKIYANNGRGTWEIITPTPIPKEREFITTEQLYTLFKEQSK